VEFRLYYTLHAVIIVQIVYCQQYLLSTSVASVVRDNKALDEVKSFRQDFHSGVYDWSDLRAIKLK